MIPTTLPKTGITKMSDTKRTNQKITRNSIIDIYDKLRSDVEKGVCDNASCNFLSRDRKPEPSLMYEFEEY